MQAQSRLLAFVLFLAFTKLAPGQTATPANENASFTMRISLMAETVKPGSEVLVTVELTNASGVQIQVWRARRGPSPYSVQVLGPAGKSGRLTPVGAAFRRGDLVVREDGKPLRIIPGGSGASVSIAPGETAKEVVSISQQFDLSELGSYTIRLERIDPATKVLVKSNTVTLTVAN